MKKIYDLSTANMMSDERRILIADSGREYDVSFRPAILNRKYYARWTDCQNNILKVLSNFLTIRNKLHEGKELNAAEQEQVDTYMDLSKEAAEAGVELIIYALRANGYEITEDELYMNFSEIGLSKGINFIMGTVVTEETKKKQISKS